MKKNKVPTPYHQMTTLELFRSYLISKLPKGKEKLVNEQTRANNPPENITINHIAIVLDGVVEDVIRCQNRMAALLLSEPQFIEFDPQKEYPQVSVTQYIDGKFVTPKNEESELSEEKIESLLEDLKTENG